MTEIRAEATLDAKASATATATATATADGEGISDQTAALPTQQQDSVPSPTRSCRGPPNPFEEHAFTESGCVSDGTMVPISFRQLGKGLP